MKPPVDTVRISVRGKEILGKIKRRTGLDRWNDISRNALCRSLANPSRPVRPSKGWDCALEIDWKTFAGDLSDVLTAAVLYRAHHDRIDLNKKEQLADYFRAHLERGIGSLHNVEDLVALIGLDFKQ